MHLRIDIVQSSNKSNITMVCAIPDNLREKKEYCTPWKQKVLTNDFQNYS